MSRLVRDVMTDAPVVSPDTSGEFVYDLFSDDKDLLVVAVVQDGQPVGMVSRDRFFVKMADRHGRALFSKRPVTFLMNKDPLLVEASTPIAELNMLIVRDRPSALMEGFLITRNGDYCGVGTALDLFRETSRESAERSHKLSALAEQLGHARIEALAASKAKSEFLATMSHEIRTPLNGVLGVAQLLMSTELNDEQTEFVRVINDSGQILLRLLNERGYIHQVTDAEGLDALAAKQIVPGYIGFDATAPSLHIGSLVQIMMPRRCNIRCLISHGTSMSGSILAGARSTRKAASLFLAEQLEEACHGGRLSGKCVFDRNNGGRHGAVRTGRHRR